MKAMAHTNGDIFPNIQVLLRIMATLPVTSCECERSISMMRLVKSQLRTTNGANKTEQFSITLLPSQGCSYGLDSGQVKIFAREARVKYFGLMNINKLIIVNNSVIDHTCQLKIFMITSQIHFFVTGKLK